MSKKKSFQTALSQWVYMNYKTGSHIWNLLKSAMEVEKLLQNRKNYAGTL